MADLHVVAVLKAKAGSEQVVGDALRALLEPTRAEEGCLAYELFESKAEAGTYVTIERWRSQADLDAHLTSDHVAAALGAAGDQLDGGPQIHPLTPA